MESRIIQEFSQLRVLAAESSTICRPADGSAVEDSNNTATVGLSSKRRVWRQRSRSASHSVTLSAATYGTSGISLKKGEKNSTLGDGEDVCSSSDGDWDLRGVGGGGSLLSSRGERGTSSLQLSDSDDCPRPCPHHLRLLTSYTGSSTIRRKKVPMPGVTLRPAATAHIESDSWNENFSPTDSLKPRTKRKRKFKRMALDPHIIPSVASTSYASRLGAVSGYVGHKRSNARETGDFRFFAPSAVSLPRSFQEPKRGAYSAASGGALVLPGKRKRSNREKSTETESKLGYLGLDPSASSTYRTREYFRDISAMDCDPENGGASSSLTSSDYDEDDLMAMTAVDGGKDRHLPEVAGKSSVDDDQEADDEQSDWPGQECLPSSKCILTDMEDANEKEHEPTDASGVDEARVYSPPISTTSTRLAPPMKRLAECVPGREIRAGSRRLRSRQRGFSIKSSCSEQVSRFLRDPSRSVLKLTVLRAADRNKVAHLANLYSLSMRYDEPCSEVGGGGTLVLTKTGLTIKVSQQEFSFPKKSHPPPPVDVKRRRRAPPAPSVPSATDIYFRHRPCPLTCGADQPDSTTYGISCGASSPSRKPLTRNSRVSAATTVDEDYFLLSSSSSCHDDNLDSDAESCPSPFFHASPLSGQDLTN